MFFYYLGLPSLFTPLLLHTLCPVYYFKKPKYFSCIKSILSIISILVPSSSEFYFFSEYCQQDSLILLRRNKPICLVGPHFWAWNNLSVNIGPDEKLKMIVYTEGGMACSSLWSKSWTWLRSILWFHSHPGSPPHPPLIERCNPCCPLSSIWFKAIEMINVLLNLLPVSLIMVLKESGLATKCHSSKCHVSLSLFVILYVF